MFFSIPLHRLFRKTTKGLSNGVMVAQQVLVLFVVVRIRLGQHKRGMCQKWQIPFLFKKPCLLK